MMRTALDNYKQVLDDLQSNSQKLLRALLIRDQVETARLQANLSNPLYLLEAEELGTLDGQLQKQLEKSTLLELSDWRKTHQPPDAHWWWFLDQAAEEQEADNNLLWTLLTGTLLTLTIPFALEIIKRLWDGAPDEISVFGTLLTLLLAASPWTESGREFAEWFLEQIRSLNPHFNAQAAFVMALTAFVLVLVGRVVGIPLLAQSYHEQGIDFLARQDEEIDLFAGNLTSAQQSFQRAVALNPDMAMGYYHLGYVYEEIAQLDKAITWYQRALEHDLDLGAAYNNLGRLYLLQEKPEQAVPLLLAGLRRTTDDTETDLVTRYRLLSNLGWAYHVLELPKLAHDKLVDAIELESQLDNNIKSAVPHYYLALTYEGLEQPNKALEQWEDSLRYLDNDDPQQIGWDETIHTHLETLRKEDA